MATVTKDPRNNHYLVRWRDPSGKQCKKSFTRKADAERWRANVVTGMSKGDYIDPNRGKQTLGEFADVWLSHQTQLKPSTFNRYQGIVVTHIKPVWGGYQLGKIATNEVNAWIGALLEAGMKPASVRQTHRILSLILDYAVTDNRIGRNTAKGANLPRAVRTDPVFLTAEELNTMANVAGGEDGLIILTLGLVGLRFGELAALRVKHFDPVRRRFRIAESVTEVGGHLVWGTTKTHQARTVSMPPKLAALIEAHVAGKTPDDLIFTAPGGQPLRLNNWRKRAFVPARAVINRPEFRPHDFRHTAASLAIQTGANVKVVQEMLGHASAAMTLDIYAGLFRDDQDSVAAAMDALIGGTGVAHSIAKQRQLTTTSAYNIA